MDFRKNSNSLIPFLVILFQILVFSVFSFPDYSIANLGDDLIARESWRKISLDLEGASLINVLKVFSQQSGLNFIAAEDVADKSITLFLEDVPIRDALEKILDTYSLTYKLDEDSNIFVVKALLRPEAETITRVYPLQYARLNSSAINSASSVSTAGTSIVDTIQLLLTSYGKLSEDSRTNSLIITDIPLRFDLIEKTIRELDVPIPQVLIEVEIIDTSKNLVDQLGFNWSNADSLFSYTLPTESGSLGFPFDLPITKGLFSGSTTRGSVSMGGSSVSLSQLRTHSDTRVLARPKILTLSNEKAEIKIIADEVIGTKITKDDEAGTTEVEAERTEIGVTLIATPSVNPKTGEITMVLEPEVSSADASSFVDVLGNSYRNPSKRSAKVTLNVKDNQTIVLGGLLRTDFNQSKTKVPILGDIPFLGALFRYKNKSEDKDREMLVFITPRIINMGDTKFTQLKTNYDNEIFNQREQSDYQYRKEEIDRALTIWDNR